MKFYPSNYHKINYRFGVSAPNDSRYIRLFYFFVKIKVDGFTIGRKTLCINVPLNCENMIPRVVESEIEFNVIMKCSGKSIC
jgi:hypothetical protein